MKKLTIDEIKEIELNMLIDVTDFCEQNGLDYFISCGTLLGAVRHKGFIPWDDDIDITMPRDSYERFISTYHSDNNYQLFSIYRDSRYHKTFARVMAMDTRRSSHKTINFDMRVCIDVFPMDFFDTEEQARNIYQHLFPVKDNTQIGTSLSARTKRGLMNSFAWPLLRPFVRLIIHKHLNRNARTADQYVQENSGHKEKYVSVLLAPVNHMPEVFQYSEIFPTVKNGSFEGHTFRVPNNSDRYLSLLYGDYMTPPSKEQRKPAHYKKAFLNE